MVWTTTPCDDPAGGMLTAIGASNQAQNFVDAGSCTDVGSCTSCRALDDTDPAVRCCADVAGPSCPAPAPPPFLGCTSFSSCGDLADAFGGAWGNPASGGSDQVCGESDHGFDEGTTLCFGGQTSGDTATDGWFNSQTICFAMGARLCTAAELLADETRGSGCGHDGEMTWTSEECDDGSHVVAVGASNQAQARANDGSCTDAANCVACAADETDHAVRCCADVDPAIGESCDSFAGTPDGCSALTCDELTGLYGGFPTNLGSDQVCGESDNGLAMTLSSGATDGNLCSGGEVNGADAAHDGYAHAVAICGAIGARLCTSEELLADETRGTGCGHDREMVWSSTPCDDGMLTAAGASNQAQNLVDAGVCTDVGSCTSCRALDDTTPAVRCCGDVECPDPSTNYPIDWIITSYEAMQVSVGDTITFTYSSSHNVYLHPSGSCDQNNAELVGDTDAGSVTYTFDAAGTYTFACNVGSHCNQGQIITVTAV
jgi:hypothetical protein